MIEKGQCAMTATYEAILRGDRLEWSGEEPPHIAEAVAVQVTILETPLAATADARRSQRVAAALERVAARDTLAAIADPVAWQRELRQERPLPGRE